MDKILIIDSSETTVELMSQRLSHYGYRTFSSNNGMSGFCKAKLFTPDLIILSSELPDMSGYDLCKKLKQTDETKSILILFMSNFESRESTIRAFELGADDFIETGCDSVILLAKVKSTLRVKNLISQLSNKYLELKEKNKLLDNQMKMGRQVQRSLIREIDMQFNNISFTSKYMPALDIGGDFYDIVKLNDDCIGVIIGDVSGHGISAALLTSMLNMMFKNLCADYLNPDQLLFYMNNQFCNVFENSDNEMYASVFYAIIDTTKKEIHYSNAGQTLPVFIDNKNQKAFELECSGFPIGLMKDSAYDYNSINYLKNDLLLFHTDGLSDAFYKDNIEVFFKKIKEILVNCTSVKDPHDVINMVLNEFYNYDASDNDKYLLDDVSLILCSL